MSQLFSVIHKSREGCTLRNTQTKIERFVTWEQINIAFKPHQNCKYLYEANEKAEIWKQADEFSAKMDEDLSAIMGVYLMARKGKTLYSLMTFGALVDEFCEKYEVTFAEFISIFQQYFYACFGVHPSFEGVLSIKDLRE